MKSSLNHIYRSIWSEALNTWVAVSEITSVKGKPTGSSLLEAAVAAGKKGRRPNRKHRFKPIESFLKPLVMAIACCYALNTQANPFGAQVVNGTAAISQSGNTLTVTNSPNAIINWQGFSINSGETTRFIQQSASSSVLNRVVGPDPSQLLGALTSNGKVFLINPAGILVGQGARIDVAGFVASTLNLSNADFLAGKLNFTNPSPVGGEAGDGVINQGTITTPEGGTVYLVAPQIENSGIITTPKGETILAAGNTVQLMDTGTPGVTVQVTGSDSSATNLGQILADSGRIGMVGAVVKNSGTVSASSMVSEGGRVFLKATNRVEAGGTIAANGTSGGKIEALGNNVGIMDGAVLSVNGAQGGGTVLVGGDFQGKNPDVPNAQVTYVAPTAAISADATQNGNGGKVIVWANDATRYYGSISARGGASGGNGGFAETSGHYLEARGKVDLSAPFGQLGTWLLDPASIEIAGGTGDGDLGGGTAGFGGTGGATQAAGQITFANGNTGPSVVYQSEIEGQSATAHITLEATDSIFTSGTFVGGMVTLASNRDLTLRTRNQSTPDLATGIDLTGSINGAGLEFVTQGTGTITIETGVGGTGPYHAAPITTGKLTSGAGITLNASGDVAINGLVKTTSGNLAITSQNGSITTGVSGSLGSATATLNAPGSIGSSTISRLIFSTIAPTSVTVGNTIAPSALYTDINGSITYGAITTNGIADILTSGGTLTFSGDVTTNNNGITIKSASNLTQNAGTTINTGTGPISISGSGFGASLDGALTTTHAGANAVLIKGIGGNLTVGNITSSGGVEIGSNFDIRGNVTQNAGTTITGNSVAIQAQGNISVQAINAGTGNVGIKVTGDVVDSNGATNNVTAGQLDVLAGGGYSLNASLSGNLNLGKLYTATGAAPTSFTAIAGGDLSINAIPISGVVAGFNAFTQSRNLALAINSTAPAGVTAYFTTAGTVGFASASAAPVNITFAGSANAANTGLTSPSMTPATTSTPFNLGAGTIGGAASVINAAGDTTFSSGNLNISGNTTFASPLTVSGGTLTLDGVSNSISSLTMSGGTLTGGGAITIPNGGTLNWSQGTIGGTAASTLTTAAGSTVNITNTGTPAAILGANRTWDNAGSATWTTTGCCQSMQVDGTLNNNGLFVINSTNAGFTNIVGTGAFNNYGELRKILNGTAGTTTFAPAFNNQATGVVNINSGLISFDGTGTDAAGSAYNVASGATLQFGDTRSIAGDIAGAGTVVFAGGAKIYTLSGDYNVSGATQAMGGCCANTTASFTGTVSNAGAAISQSWGSLDFSGIASGEATGFASLASITGAGGSNLTFKNGTLLPALNSLTWGAGAASLGNQSVSLNTLDLSGGTLTGSGAITIPGGGMLNWSGNGVIDGTAASTLTTAAGSTVNITNSATLGANRTWDNAGSATWTTTGCCAGVTVNGTLNNNAGSLFVINSTNSGFTDINGTGTFNNYGELRKVLNGAAGTTVFAPAFNNQATGVVNIDSGIFALNGTGADLAGSAYNIASGATLQFSNSRNIAGSVAGTGTLNVTAGTVNLDNAAATNLTELNLSGGTLGGTSNVVLGTGSSFNWTGGTVAGHLTTQGTTSIPSGTITLGAGALWDNSGAVTITSGGWGYIGANAVLNNSGSIDIGGNFGTNFNGVSGGQFNNLAAGTVTLSGAWSAPITGAGGTFSNAGTLTKTTATVQTITNLSNTGTVNVNSSTLGVAGALIQSGTINVASGATFSKTAGFTNTGILSGTGTIEVGTGAAGLINQGDINPAGTGAAGTLAVTGDLQLSTGSNLNIELGGTGAGQSDKLAVTGDISTDGTLNASLLVGYTPVNADAIPFITMGGTASGTFATTNLPAGFSAGYNLAANEAVRLIYAGGGTITFTNAAGGLDWAAPGNWSSGILPSSLDTALLSSGFAVTHATGTDTIAALTINSGNYLDISGGSLTVSGITTLDGGLTVSGTGSAALNGALNGATSGQVNVSAGSLNLGAAASVSSLSMTGGTLNAGGNMTVTQSFAKASGATGSLVLAGGSSISITQAAGDLVFYNDQPIELGAVTSAGNLLINTTVGAIVATDNISASGGLTLGAVGGISQTAGTVSAAGASLTAGTGDIVLDNALNNLGSVSVSSGRDVTLKSAYNGGATISLPQAAGGVRNVAIDYASAPDVWLSATGCESWCSGGVPMQLSGNLAVISGGTIGHGGAPFSWIELTTAGSTSTFTAGGDIALNQAGNYLGAVTVNPGVATINVNLRNNSGDSSLTINSTAGNLTAAIASLTLVQPNAGINLNTPINGNINASTGGSITLSGMLGGSATLTAGAGTGDIVLDNALNNLVNVSVNSGRDVVLKSAYNGGATISLPQAAGGVRNVTIDYASAPALWLSATGCESWCSGGAPMQLSGNLAVISGGTIGHGGAPFSWIELIGAAPTSAFTVGGNIALNQVGNYLGAVTVNPDVSTFNIDLRNNSASASLAVNPTASNPAAAIASLTLVQPNAGINLNTPINGAINASTGGNITLSGVLGGSASLTAGAGIGDIVLDNAANNLGYVTVNSGRDVMLKSAYNLDAVITLPQAAGGVRNVTIDYASAPGVWLSATGCESWCSGGAPAQLGGNLAVISGGVIGHSGTPFSWIELIGAAPMSSFTAGGNVALNQGGNYLGAVTVNPTVSTVNVDLYNNSANANLNVISPVTNLALTQPNASLVLSDNMFTGSLAINTGGGTAGSNIAVGSQTSAGAWSLTSDGNTDFNGIVNINSGTFSVTGALTQSGTINIATGAVFSASAGFTNTGTLSGVGTITVGTGAAGLVNQGSINPGGTGVAGTLAVTGDVQLSTGSNLNVELGGTGAGQSDVLAVTGSITTAGALNASLLAGYTPVNADAISFMTMGGTASGTFTTTNLPAGFSAGYNLAAGEAARLIYASGPGTFTFTNAAGGLDWAAPGNWSSGILPGSLDTALLSSGFAVTHATGTDTIAALTINSGNALDISGGSLTVSGITTLDGGLTVSGTGSAILNGALNGATSGQVSVSGGSLSLGDAASVNTLSMAGGTLASPAGLTVDDYTQTSGTLNIGGTTLLKSTGSMTVNGAIASNVGGMLTLQAVNNISLGTGGSITGTVAPLNVILNSSSNGTGGAISLAAGASIASNGGNITLGGGSGVISAGVGFARGDNGAGFNSGVAVHGNLAAAGGDIVINGMADTFAWTPTGVEISGGMVSTTGNGTITLTGQYINAGGLGGVAIGTSGSGAGYVSSVDGDILINGASGGNQASAGVSVYNGSFVQATGSGNVTLNGVAGNSNAAVTNADSRGIDIELGASVHTNSGTLTLNGTNVSASSAGTRNGVNINGGSTVSSQTGAINLIGTGGTGTGIALNNWVYGSSGSVASASGNILLRSLSGAGVELTGATLSTTGNITLDAVGGGAIAQTNGSITAAGLRVLGDTSATASLTSAANHVATLAGDLSGATAAMSYVDSGSFNIGSLTTDGIGLGAATTTNGLSVGTAASSTLTLSAGGTINANNDVSAGAFTLNGGTWNQVNATLPGFAVNDFRIVGGTFIRAIGGNGTAGTPYQLTDIYGVQGMGSAGMLGNAYVLANNIDATGTANWSAGAGFAPVGDAVTVFSGNFNGQNNTIANLTINRPGTAKAGLFGASGGTVSNVGLLGGSVSGGTDSVGGLVGWNTGTGNISNSYNTGVVLGALDTTGGLVGSNDGSISNSYATGNVTGGRWAAAGFVGGNQGTIIGSYSTGNVIGAGSSGGFAGWNAGTGTITNSYATGNTRNHGSGPGCCGWMGGLVGDNMGAISNSYATGNTVAEDRVGGLVGHNNGGSIINSYSTGNASANWGTHGGLIGGWSAGTVTNSYWNMDTSGLGFSAGGTGLTAAQMMQASSFTGWNIANTGGSGTVWRIYEGHTAPLLTSFMTTFTLTGAQDSTVTYNGVAQSGATYGVVDPNVLGVAATGINAGFYNGYYSTQQGYDLVGGNLTISPKVVTLTGSKIYDGLAVFTGGTDLFVTTSVGTETLALNGTASTLDKNVGNTDLTSTGTLNIADGTGLASNYTLAGVNLTGTITITPRALTGAITGGGSTYGGAITAGTAGLTGVIGGDLVNAGAVTVNTGVMTTSTSGNFNAGTYIGAQGVGTALAGADAGNYTFAGATADYTVGQLALTGTSVAAVTTTYGTVANSGTVGFGNVIAGDNVTATALIMAVFGVDTSSSGNLNAGSYAQSVANLTGGLGSDANNYIFSPYTTPTANYTVTPRVLTGGITGGGNTYSGAITAGTAGLTGVIGGDLVNAGAVTVNTGVMTTSTSGNFNAGTYVGAQGVGTALTGADAGNYTFAGATADYTISQLAITGGITGGGNTYGGTVTAGTAGLTGVIGGDLVNAGAVTVNTGVMTTSTSGNFNAGTYVGAQSVGTILTGADAGNYSFAGSTAVYTINQLVLTGAAIGAVNTTYGTPAGPGAVTFGNVVAGDTVGTTATIDLATYSSSGNLNAGSYTQTASTLSGADAGNYSFAGFTSAANYTITPLALTGSITAGTSVYGSTLAPGTVSFTNAVAGDTLGAATVAVNTAGNTSTSGNLRAGGYTGIQSVSALSGADAGNYTFAGIVGNYTVNTLALTGAAIAGVTATYGTPAATGAVTFGNAISGDAVSSTASINSPTYSGSGNLNAGSYTQTASTLSGADAGNYSFGGFTTAGANYIVNPALLSIIANADSKIYDGLAYSGGNGVVYSGLVNGEASSVLGGTLFYSGTSQGAIEVGSYSIAPDGLTSGNYSISYVDGTLTVTPPITPEVLQTLDMLTTTNTLVPATSDAVTSDEPSTAPVDVDANALLGATATGAAGGNATTTGTTAGWTIGGTAGAFGGSELAAPASEPAPSVDVPAGTDKVGEIGGSNGSGKNGDADKQEGSNKDADENIARKSKGKDKDKDDNKDKPSEKPEKC